MIEKIYRIAGLHLAVRGNAKLLEKGLRPCYEKFEDPLGEPLCCVQLQAEDALQTGLNRAEIQIRKLPGESSVEYRTYANIGQADLGRGEALLRVRPINAVADGFIRFLLSEYLLPRQGLLVHAAGVIHQGLGYLFCGKSGAGKSTLAKLFHHADRGFTVLNDEVMALRLEGDGRLTAYGTPFVGMGGEELASPSYAPVAGIFILHQAEENLLRELEPQKAGKELLKRMVVAPKTARESELALDLVQRTLSAVKIFDIQRRKDLSFWELLKADS